MATNDPRVVTISFVGEVDNLETQITHIKNLTKNLGLEVKSGFSSVNAETKEVSSSFDLLAKSIQEAERAAKVFQGQPSSGITRVKSGYETSETKTKRELEALRLYSQFVEEQNQKEVEKARLKEQQLREEAAATYKFKKSLYEQLWREQDAEIAEREAEAKRWAQLETYLIQNLLREQKEYSARKAHLLKEEVAQAKLDQKALTNIFLDIAEKHQRLLRQTSTSFGRSSDKAFGAVNATLNIEQARREGNAIRAIRLELARTEQQIEEQKNTILLGLRRRLLNGLTTIERAETVRSALIEKYQREITAAREAAQQLLEIEKKKAAIVSGSPNEGRRTGFGIGLLNLARVNLEWDLINRIQSGISSAISSIVPLGIKLDAVKASLESTAGSGIAVGSILGGLRKEAERTGLEIGNLRTSFKLFQASTSLAGASLQDTWKMFTNINTVATALHLNTDEINSVFLAMSQIFNKSKVQAEELVRQLGNLLPGAFASFAKSMEQSGQLVLKEGQTATSKLIEMMEAGQVFAQKTMLGFTQFMAERFAGSFAMASRMLNADIGRMNTQFTYLVEGIYSISSGPIQSFVQGITEAAKATTDFVTDTDRLTKTLNGLKVMIASGVIGALGAFIAPRIAFINGLSAISIAALAGTKSLDGMKAAWAFVSGPGAIIAGLSAITLGITEYLHSLNAGVEGTMKFVAEIEKLKKEREATTPEQKLNLAVENNPIVAKFEKKLDEVWAKYRAARDGGIKDWSITTEMQKEINTQIELLRKYEPQLTAITDEEQRRNMTREKSMAVWNAYFKYLADENRYAKERARMEEGRRQNNEVEEGLKNLYGAAPRKAPQQSDVLEATTKVLKLELERAKVRKDFNRELEISNQLQAAETAQSKQKVAENYKESFDYISRTLGEIEGRLGADKYTDPRYKQADQDKKLALLKDQMKLQAMQRGEMADADREALARQQGINAQIEAEGERHYKAQKKQTEAAIQEIKNDLAQINALYKTNQMSIGAFYTSKGALEKERLKEELNLAEHHLADYKGTDENKIEGFEADIKRLKQELSVVDKTILTQKHRDLELYNRELQKSKADYLEFKGLVGEARVARFQAQTTNWKNRNLSETVSENNDPAQVKAAQEELARIQQRETFEFASGKIQEYQTQMGYLDKQLATKQTLLRTLQRTGSINEFNVMLQTGEAFDDYIAKQEKIIQNWETLNMDGSEAMQQQLAEAKARLEEFRSTSSIIGNNVKETLSATFVDSFTPFITGAQTASQAFKNFGQSIAETAARLVMQQAIQGILSLVFQGAGALSGAVTAPAVLSAGPQASGAITYPVRSEKGNVLEFSKGGIPRVGSKKDYFPLANGGVGSLRENGPEGIFPLSYDSKGRLGVTAVNSEKNSANVVNIQELSIHVQAPEGQNPAEFGQKTAEAFVAQIADLRIAQASRPGGLLNKTTRF